MTFFALALAFGTGQAALAIDGVEFGVEQDVDSGKYPSHANWVTLFDKPGLDIRSDLGRLNKAAAEIKFVKGPDSKDPNGMVVKTIVFSFHKRKKQPFLQESPDPYVRFECYRPRVLNDRHTVLLSEMTVRDTPGDWKVATWNVPEEYRIIQRVAVVVRGKESREEDILDFSPAEVQVASFELNGEKPDHKDLHIIRENKQHPFLNSM